MTSKIIVNNIEADSGISSITFNDSIFVGDINSSGTSTFNVVSGVSTIGVTTVHLTGINDLSYPTAGPLSNRNLIINAAMQVAQRGTSQSSVTSTGYYTVDRFQLNTTDEATYTMEQSTDAPAGFKNSLKFTVTTADSSIAADDYAACHYLIEGNDIVPLGFGASGAKSFTLSFYVKSSQTVTFGLNFQNYGNDRNFDSSYTINTADTWERKTITIPGDTSGTWTTDNGAGLKIWWSFLVGSTYEASAVSTSWGGTLGLGLNGQVQLSSIINATWQITGVQLEVGTRATPFEHRSFGDELLKCQRYYETGNWHGMYKTSDDTMGWVNYKVTKRANPSVTSIAPGGTTTNRIYYYSTDSADRGERNVDINNTAWTGGMTDFTNSFYGILGNFTPSQTNDATFHGIYRADAEM